MGTFSNHQVMKQQKWNKVLVPAVICIWVGVLFRFVGSCSASDKQQHPVTQSVKLELGQNERAHFDLDLTYLDPFLHQPARKRKPTSTPANHRKGSLIPIPPPKPKLQLPTFVYQGGVKSPGGGFTGLLMADDQIMNIQQGDTVFGMHVHHLGLQSVSLSHPDSLIVLSKK